VQTQPDSRLGLYRAMNRIAQDKFALRHEVSSAD
jgi:hypothetical protein